MITISKYNNKKVIIDEIIPDSRDESLYYLLLKSQKENGLIKDFILQPKYELLPKFEYFGQKKASNNIYARLQCNTS